MIRTLVLALIGINLGLSFSAFAENSPSTETGSPVEADEKSSLLQSDMTEIEIDKMLVPTENRVSHSGVVFHHYNNYPSLGEAWCYEIETRRNGPTDKICWGNIKAASEIRTEPVSQYIAKDMCESLNQNEGSAKFSARLGSKKDFDVLRRALGYGQGFRPQLIPNFAGQKVWTGTTNLANLRESYVFDSTTGAFETLSRHSSAGTWCVVYLQNIR